MSPAKILAPHSALEREAADAARRVSQAAGRALLAHELVHVWQQSKMPPAGGRLFVQRDSGEFGSSSFEGDRSMSEAACALGDRRALSAAKWGKMKWGGLGPKMFDHYLSGKGGTFEVNLKSILDGDAGMRISVVTQILDRMLEARAEGLSGGQMSGSVFVPQSDYTVEDNQLAFGGTYLYWHVDSSKAARDANKKDGRTRVIVELIDRYFWSLHDPRPTQCLHEAAERLKAEGAKELIQHGKATLELSLSEDVVFRPGDPELTVRQGTTAPESP